MLQKAMCVFSAISVLSRRPVRLAQSFGLVLGAALALIVVMPILAAAGALPDISWRKTVQPIHGSINRDEITPIRLTLSADAQIPQVEVVWKLFKSAKEGSSPELSAEGDTMISAMARTREKSFIIHLPAE